MAGNYTHTASTDGVVATKRQRSAYCLSMTASIIWVTVAAVFVLSAGTNYFTTLAGSSINVSAAATAFVYFLFSIASLLAMSLFLSSLCVTGGACGCCTACSCDDCT